MVAKKDVPEFIGQIIDIFEDFLEEKGVTHADLDFLESGDSVDSDNGTTAVIYGSLYDDIAVRIKNLLSSWKLFEEENEHQTVEEKVRENLQFYGTSPEEFDFVFDYQEIERRAQNKKGYSGFGAVLNKYIADHGYSLFRTEYAVEGRYITYAWERSSAGAISVASERCFEEDFGNLDDISTEFIRSEVIQEGADE